MLYMRAQFLLDMHSYIHVATISKLEVDFITAYYHFESVITDCSYIKEQHIATHYACIYYLVIAIAR